MHFLIDYLEAGESKYTSLIMRHQTLYESNVDLFESLIANSDKVSANTTQVLPTIKTLID